uniref:Uncharacterized protein n=1 Tax=Cacopsylla melanoneura TaxID=428564 RepID=A0A8D8ZA18_9HEMI
MEYFFLNNYLKKIKQLMCRIFTNHNSSLQTTSISKANHSSEKNPSRPIHSSKSSKRPIHSSESSKRPIHSSESSKRPIHSTKKIQKSHQDSSKKAQKNRQHPGKKIPEESQSLLSENTRNDDEMGLLSLVFDSLLLGGVAIFVHSCLVLYVDKKEPLPPLIQGLIDSLRELTNS